jgi:hypothetical protein
VGAGLGFLLAVAGVVAPLALAWFLLARDADRHQAPRTPKRK